MSHSERKVRKELKVEYIPMSKIAFLLCAVMVILRVFSAEEIPMKFCGLKLGQIVPEGISPTSKTEMYYGYGLPAKEKILKFNQYQFHASLISKTVTNAGAGYTTESKQEAETLFADTCRWLERKYPGKKCEDYKLSNRTIKVMRFGEDTDGYYMVELIAPMPDMHLVMISLYNNKLSKIEEREANEFASKKMVGQSAPLQFNVQRVNNAINQGKSLYSGLTNSVAQSATRQASPVEAFDRTKETMMTIRRSIESYQRRGKTRAAPKDINALKAIAKACVRTWKDGWGCDFVYKCDGDRWALQSAGVDKKYDTDDDLIYICEDGMNVTTVGFPTGNGVYLDSEIIKQNKALREKADENEGGCPDGWTRIEISSFVSVDVPPTMELQKGLYKNFKEVAAKISLNLDLRSQALTLQQAGLNDLSIGSTRRYARIIFKSYYDKDGDFDMSDDDLTPDVLKHIEDDEYSKTKKSLEQVKRAGLGSPKLIKWYPVQKIQLGGLSGYRVAILRQQGSNPPVYVEEYKLGCGRYLHTVIFSYRQNEEGFWKSDYSEIKRRIKFNKSK
jgi:hypothetical protein